MPVKNNPEVVMEKYRDQVVKLMEGSGMILSEACEAVAGDTDLAVDLFIELEASTKFHDGRRWTI